MLLGMLVKLVAVVVGQLMDHWNPVDDGQSSDRCAQWENIPFVILANTICFECANIQ